MKRLLSTCLAALLLLGLCAGCAEPAPTTGTASTAAPTTEPTAPPVVYTNSTVVLYTANIRGDLQVYSQIAAAKAHYEMLGAKVYLVDAGNYLQGSIYTGSDMGLTAYYLMDALGYSVAGMGVYDFAYGDGAVGHIFHGDFTRYYTQAELYRGTEELTYQKNPHWAEADIYATRAAKAAAAFQVICSNLQIGADATGYYDFEASAVLGEELRVGFVSCLPENAPELIREDYLTGYTPCEVAAPDCDILVALGAGEGDIVIDVPADGSLAVGAWVIDHTSHYITYEAVELSRTNEAVDTWIEALPLAEQFGTCDADLAGTVAASCNGQSDLSAIVAEALQWYGSKLEGIEYPIVGLFNGGSCIGSIYSGVVTMLDIQNAIHCSKDGIGVVYLTGAQLLEVLEAATQQENCPGWAYVSGLTYTVDTAVAYDGGAAYGPYYKANSVNRVAVTSANFDPAATYAVVADRLLLAGENTYYLLAEQEIVLQDETDIHQILKQYIQEEQEGNLFLTSPMPQMAVEVIFDACGGSCKPSVSIAGSAYGRLPTPEREGYRFLGWFTAAEGGEEITAETALPDGRHTLYAHWEPETRLTVTLDANGGHISAYQNTLKLHTGDTYGKLPTPIREGYRFLGWYTEPENGKRVKSTTKFAAEADQVLYAHWEYDALAYWQHILDNTVQQIPYCRRVVVYLERSADFRTYNDSPLLAAAGAINPAEGLDSYKVTDGWIRAQNAYLIIKLTSDTGLARVSKLSMQRRFPDGEIYVFSTSAITGSEKYQLYCQLYLAKLLYPEYFENVDLEAVKDELNVKATIYY